MARKRFLIIVGIIILCAMLVNIIGCDTPLEDGSPTGTEERSDTPLESDWGGKDDISVQVGESFQLRAYTVPSDSKDTIVWQSDDSTVARVDEKGKLQAIGKGKTTITAYAPNGVNGKLIVRCK